MDANQKTLEDSSVTELWEIKCVAKLEPEHALQLLIYGWIYQSHHGKTPRLFMYNVLTDEQVELMIQGDLSEFMALLIESRYGQGGEDISDETFLSRLKNPKQEKTVQQPIGQSIVQNCLIGSDSESE